MHRNLFRLNPAGEDRSYCFIKGGHGYAIMQRGGPVLERMKEDGINALEYEIDESKGGLTVGDYFRTATNHLTVSCRFAEALSAQFNLGTFELLPAVIRDKKKKVFVPEIIVVNPVEAVDCLDWEKSQLDGDIEYPLVRIFGSWSLKAERIPDALDLYRVRGLIGYIFSEQLVNFIREAGYKGFAFESVNLS
jgi:hypothetical protein